MFEAFLVTTSSEGLKPLGTAPQRSFELVTGTVRRRLGDRHAALFAEPVATDFGDSFDWYATTPGRARRLADLPGDAARAAVLADLEALRAAVRAEAARIEASGEPDDLRLAEALANALEVPDESFIWTVEDASGAVQPVLVNWARVSDRQAVVRGSLQGADTRAAARDAARSSAALAAAAAPVPPAPQVREGSPAWVWPIVWLGWLLLLAMLTAILYLMIAPCALRPAFLPSFCPPPPPLANAELAATQLLEDEVALLVLRIADADRACQPLPPPPPPPPPPAPAPAAAPPTPPAAPPQQRSEIDRRLDAAGAQRGSLAFSLAWNSRSDLDLHVTCAGGTTVFYGNRNGCGGALDIDANADSFSDQPIENIYFTTAGGVYQVRVNLFSSATGGRPEPFQLQIRDQSGARVIEGVVTPGAANWSMNYTAGGD